MSHLEEGVFHALLDGEIPSTELLPIQAHLAACAECRARLEEERQFRAEADGLVVLLEAPAPGSSGAADVSATRPARVPAGRGWRDLAWAASLVAAVGLGYAARGWRAPSAAPAESITKSTGKAESVETRISQPVPASPIASAVADRAETREGGAAGPGRKLSPPAFRERSKSSVVAQREEAKVTAAEPAADAAAPPALTPAPAPVPAASVPAPQAVRRDQPKPELLRLDEVVGTGATTGRLAMAKRVAGFASRPDTISFQDALTRLGGAMRLIEGLVPVRLEAQGDEVFVVYPVRGGELLLAQQRVDARLVYRLIAPAGFPADSLERLRARVRE